MSKFSLLVRKKIETLDSEQKLIFDEEYNRRKKPFGDDYNSDLAMDILRDIALTFENTKPLQKNSNEEVKNLSQRKSSGNTSYLPPNRQSRKSYLFNFICVLIIAFIGVSVYTKPTKVQMENDIINQFLETQPQFIKFFKNIFLGEEITEEKADTLIYNFFKTSGYEIYFKIDDFGIVKRFEILDQASDKSLIVAYGFLGRTFMTYKADNLVIDFGNSKINSNSNIQKQPEKYEKIKDSDYAPGYWDKINKHHFNEKPLRREKQKSEIPKPTEKKENLNKLKTNYKEDSIKI